MPLGADLVAALLGPALAQAVSSPAPADLATPAQSFRSALADAQVELSFDGGAARKLLAQATRTYQSQLRGPLTAVAPDAVHAIDADLSRAAGAVNSGDEPSFAVARSRAWTALLGGSLRALEAATLKNDLGAAQAWLAVREYRSINRFTRLNADATVALGELAAGKIRPEAALVSVRSDLLDGYQARLTASLDDLKDDLAQAYKVRATEQTALARGYFALLRPAYAQQKGEAAAEQATRTFAALPGSLNAATELLGRFRAAPLSAREQRLRAGQVTRFLALVPTEYGRGVADENGRAVVKRDLEVTEARTFLAGVSTAFADLAPLLIGTLNSGLAAAATHQNPPTVATLQGEIAQVQASIGKQFPEAWRQRDASGDLDVIGSQLNNLVQAVGAGDYTLAETARLDAYATLESGPEARIAVFAPDLKLRLENLFWNGDLPAGLARLIRDKAPLTQVQDSRKLLNVALGQTGELLGTEQAPAAVATNAGVIVFREGLEAVLILAALMGSLRRPEVRHLRKPMWWGAALAFVATAVTWVVMGGTLSLFARFGEKLEAVVSVVAIAVLLVIMNWFVHQVYWNDRMADFQKTKHNLMGRQVGQWVGLTLLGFTSIYREGFETVLFLQSLVLQSGNAPVLSGTALGLAAVIGVGVLVFSLQAKLPMKKLLVWTGLMICAVLAIMVGNTVHVLQLVGWFPVHGVAGLELPFWTSLWLGVYPTWEGLVGQVVAVGLVIGSYFLSEALKERGVQRKLKQARQGRVTGA